MHHGFGKAGEIVQDNVGVSECAGWPLRYRHLWGSVCACHGRKDAATQVSHQRRRHISNSNWLEYRQQFNSGAPALNLLISSDVSAHATRIRFHKRGGKLLALSGPITW